jgi:hypothetical protein
MHKKKVRYVSQRLDTAIKPQNRLWDTSKRDYSYPVPNKLIWKGQNRPSFEFYPGTNGGFVYFEGDLRLDFLQECDITVAGLIKETYKDAAKELSPPKTRYTG